MSWQEFFLRVAKPITRFFAYRRFPFTRKKITGLDYFSWRDLIEPGTVMLTTTKGELSNLLNPARIKHGGIYVGHTLWEEFDEEVPTVVEAVGRGVVKTDLVSFLTQKDYIVGLEPCFKIDYENLTKLSLASIGSGYDYYFKKDNKKYYCFELIAHLFEQSSGVSLKMFDYWGHSVYNPDSFLRGDHFRIVFKNLPDDKI